VLTKLKKREIADIYVEVEENKLLFIT